jgi:sugar lactone lactonase YvrE
MRREEQALMNSAGRFSTGVATNRGVAAWIFRALGVSASFRGTGASSFGVSRVGHVALVVVALAGVLLVPTAASGAPKGTVAVFGQGDPDDPSVPPVSAPAGVAVHQGSGDVYVVDANYDRIQQFDQDGEFIRTWGSSGAAEGEFSFFGQYAGIAVASDGAVYVADAGNNRIQKFTADGTFVSTWGLDVDPASPGVFAVCTTGCQGGLADSVDGAMSNPLSVAVNPSGGDVVVADQYNNRIQRFDADGGYEAQFATNNPQSVAVDSTGSVYVVEQFGGSVEKFDADGTDTDPDGPFYQGNASIGALSVDPATDHLFLTQYHYNPVSGDFEGSEVLELDAVGATVDEHRTRPDLTDAFGVAVNSTSGRIYASQTYEDRIFILDDPVQTATIEPATNLDSRSATLHGSVNPGGDLPVGYRFEVSGDDGATWTPFPVPDENVGSGTADIPVSQDATGLDPNADYRVRLVVSNEFGSTVVSDETTFTTDPEPPDVETLPATQIRSTSALVAGSVNPNTLQTEYHFEYGTTTAYGSPVPLPGASAGSGASPVTVVSRLTGLQPNTLYHYRIVASNDAGVTRGADRTFTTRPAATAPDDRGFELVSPAYKVGGTGVGAWYSGPSSTAYTGVAAHDAERFVSTSTLGSVLLDGGYAMVNDWAMAERTSGGWVNRPVFERPLYGPHFIGVSDLNATNGDMSVSMWGGEKPLKVFPEMAAPPWPPGTGSWRAEVLRRWTDPAWELFSPLDPIKAAATADVPDARAIAADGSAVIASSYVLRGLGGPGDPTDPVWPDLVCATSAGGTSVTCPRNVYRDEIAGPFSDEFPGDDGVRELVNVCTEGTVLPSGPCEPPGEGRDSRLTSPGGAAISTTPSTMRSNVISEDGSRAFFMSPDPGYGESNVGRFGVAQLFVSQRRSDGSRVTRWISQTEVAGQNPSLRAPAIFEGASADGDKVFFRTTAPLTVDDSNGQGVAPAGGVVSGLPDVDSSDVFMYDMPGGPDADPAGGDLVRITAGPTGDSDCNAAPGNSGVATPESSPVRFVSDDGVRVYVACNAPLTGVSGSGNGTTTAPAGGRSPEGPVNLYLYDASKLSVERWRFLARLPGAETSTLDRCATSAQGTGSPFQSEGSGIPPGIVPLFNCFHATPDGSFATFLTDGQLTSDDDDAAIDVYAYDAVRGELSRVTAPQGGEGVAYSCNGGNPEVCRGEFGFGSKADALERVSAVTGPDGARMVFFQSRSRLVPSDTDEAYDVYQWRDGGLSLLSVGASTDAFYRGNDRLGRNVYVVTRDQLSWEDTDRVLDVYTARVGGGFAPPAPPAVCAVLVDQCQGAGVGAPSPVVGDQTGRPALDGDAVARARAAVKFKRLTKAQRRALAADRTVSLRVTVNVGGRVAVTGRAKVGRRARRVLSASETVGRAATVKVALRLSAAGRRQLARTGRLSISLRVAFSKAPRALTSAVKLTWQKAGSRRRATVSTTRIGR